MGVRSHEHEKRIPNEGDIAVLTIEEYALLVHTRALHKIRMVYVMYSAEMTYEDQLCKLIDT